MSASDLRLAESWFRDAIFADPELVIGPCREAGRVPSDEVWLSWATEFDFGAGPVDVLLLSSRGRPAIVETKLSYNSTKRREVVAQVLDYALSLQEAPLDELPPLPALTAAPEAADLHDCLSAGKFLLIVAGDELDRRAVRLSEALLAGHLTSEWDLAMVDLNLYQSKAAKDEILLVPELRGMVLAETRQVVRVQVEGETPRARISVERIPADDLKADSRAQLTSVADFLVCVRRESPTNEDSIRRVVKRFDEIDDTYNGRFVHRLQAATANLYWVLSNGTRRRIFAMGENGRFRVWLHYVLSIGRDDAAAVVRELSKPVVDIPSGETSGALEVGQHNVAAILLVIDSIAAAVSQMDPTRTGVPTPTPSQLT